MWNFEMSYPNRTKWKKVTIINDQIQQAWLGLFYLTYITVQVLAERKALRSMRTFGRCYLKCRSISVSKRTSQKDHYSSSDICFVLYIYLPPTILNSNEFQWCIYIWNETVYILQPRLQFALNLNGFNFHLHYTITINGISFTMAVHFRIQVIG